jgi:hypothetical protein
MKRDPIEAFAWLIEQFRQYTQNQTTWLEVREVLREAEEQRDALRAEQILTGRIIELARDIRDIVFGGAQMLPKAELDDALTEYDSLIETSD